MQQANHSFAPHISSTAPQVCPPAGRCELLKPAQEGWSGSSHQGSTRGALVVLSAEVVRGARCAALQEGGEGGPLGGSGGVQRWGGVGWAAGRGGSEALN